MEQQPSEPSTPVTSSRDNKPLRSLSSPNTSQSALSTSEPSLRFPRPLGSRHLANWISSSNPDIMRLTTTTEESGLAESTYELISGTDTESQDGNYTESMGESVGSLDFARPDDVHSLAGTEQTHEDDDEDDHSVVDEADTAQNPADQPRDDSEQDTFEQSTFLDRSQAADEESEDDARSRSSLEYTQQSLGTPSMTTPEASKVIERPLLDLRRWLPEHVIAHLDKAVASAWGIHARVQQRAGRAVTAAIPAVVLALAVAIYCMTFARTAIEKGDLKPSAAALITATPNPPALLSSSKTSAASKATPSFLGGVGLIPLEEAVADDWLFGGQKQPNITFASRAPKEVVVHVPASVKRAWLFKDCLTVTATRNDGTSVDTTVSSVDEGILIQFPKQETHGVLNLALTSTCRPKVHKEVKTHFDKGIMDEALEMTKNIAHDLGELVPAAAQEAERRFEGARKSLITASGVLGAGAQTFTEHVYKSLQVGLAHSQKSLAKLRLDKAQNSLEHVKRTTEEAARTVCALTQQAGQNFPEFKDIQQSINLGVLNAQISAKLWWLKAIGKKTEHDTYQSKAKVFLEAKRESVNGVLRKVLAPTEEKTTLRSWTKMLWRA